MSGSSPAGFSATTPSGVELVELEIPHGSVARSFSEDLANYYPSFMATPHRAVTNAVTVTFKPTGLSHTRAFADLTARYAKLGLPIPSKVCPCNMGLVMGDRNANDFAVEAHWQLLVSSGSFPSHARIVNRSPFPRGGHIEGLVVDDHFGIAIDKPRAKTNALRVAASFEAGRRGYAQANLKVSEDDFKWCHRRHCVWHRGLRRRWSGCCTSCAPLAAR